MVATFIKKPTKISVQANQRLHISDNNTVEKEEQIIGDMLTIRHNCFQRKNDPQLINVCQVL